MDNFFEKKKSINEKCLKCNIYKKKLSEGKSNYKPIIKGNGEVLVILESPEYEKYRKNIINWLDSHQIINYEIISGIECFALLEKVPSPYYNIYSTCNLINENKYKNKKVIITLGRALYSVTKCDDIGSWIDLCEYQFNQTYFYTGYEWNRKIRVYPVPIIVESKMNFESYFANKQLSYIKEYLNNYSDFEYINPKYEKIEDPNEFLKKYIDYSGDMAWDLETSHLDHFADDFEIRCLTLSFDGNNGYYLPYEKINKRLLTNFFKNKYQILANGKFDCKALYLDGIRNCKIDEDITILFHMLNTERQTNGLKSLSWLIGLGGYEKDLETFKEKFKIKKYTDIPENILLPYACIDPISTFRLFKLGMQLKEKQPNIFNMYKEVIIPSIPVFMKMEINGIDIDFDYLKKLNNELTIECSKLKEEIYEIFGKKFDINSPEQLAILIEDSGYPCHGRMPKKSRKIVNDKGVQTDLSLYLVGEEPLQKWKKQGHLFAEKLLQYRSCSKLQNAFVGEIKEVKEKNNFFNKIIEEGNKKEIEGLTKFIKKDGKIHGTIDPGRAHTMRTTAHNPNLQQMPKQGKEGKRFRPIFKTPNNDYLFFEADYSGFQLRIGAIESKDEVMKDIFCNKNGDMHSLTAQSFFTPDLSIEEFLKVKGKEPYKTYRSQAKSINFRFEFGGGFTTFEPTVKQEWSEESIQKYIEDNKLEFENDFNGNEMSPSMLVAKHLREQYFKTYPGLWPWIQNRRIQAKKNGYVDDLHGVRRHLLFLKHSGNDTKGDLLANLNNIAVNSPVQTFEAIEVYKALVKIDNEFENNKLKSKLIAMIHDSICGIVHKLEIEKVYYILKNCMEDKTTWSIPILADIQIGNILGFSEEINDKNLKEFLLKNKI
jgi:DNA polymerase-1